MDPGFAAAVGKSLAGWQQLCAQKWEEDLDPNERDAYIAALFPDERVEFFLDIVGSGGQAARVRGEFAQSPSYRLGDALLSAPRAVRDQARGRLSATHSPS